MSVLDADAIKTDPAGMAFLRAVLQSDPGESVLADLGHDPLQRFRPAEKPQPRESQAKSRRRRVHAVV